MVQVISTAGVTSVVIENRPLTVDARGAWHVTPQEAELMRPHGFVPVAELRGQQGKEQVGKEQVGKPRPAQDPDERAEQDVHQDGE